MWGMAQVKFAGENAWARGVFSLHQPGWVLHITYPPDPNAAELAAITYPAGNIEQIEWLDLRVNPFEKEPNALMAAKGMLDHYRPILYPQGGPEGAAPEAPVAQA